MTEKSGDPAATRCSVVTKGNWHIVRVKEEIGWETDNSWLEGLVADLCRKDGRNVALALDKKSYLHSKIVALLVACSKAVRGLGHEFGLLEPTPHVKSTLKAMKLLDAVVKVYESEADLA